MGLREIRKSRGLTLQQLAELSGVHYMKIQQIETGKINSRNMALKNAVKLATALDCDPSELIETSHEEK